MKINCTKGTVDQMIDAFKSRVAELDGIGIDSSFDYPDDLIDLENGEYESHVTEPINSSEDVDPNAGRRDEVIAFLGNKGYDVNNIEVKNYADAVAEYLDMCEEAWHNTGEQFSYSLSDWYRDTLDNYPEELESLPMVETACNSISAASDGPVKLHVEYEVYERYGGSYGGSTGLRKANVSGPTLLDALKKMVDKMRLYIDSEQIEDEEMTAEDVIDSIDSCNGDGCDYITLLKNVTTGEVLIESEYYPDEEEDWDD